MSEKPCRRCGKKRAVHDSAGRCPPDGKPAVPPAVEYLHELQEHRRRLTEALTKADKSLRQWDGQNEGQRYADKFVWEAWDTIRAALKEKP